MKTYQNFTEAYPEIIRDVLENGKQTAPRGMPIKEITGYSFRLESMDKSVPLQKARKVNYKFAVIEGLLNILGEYPKDIVLMFNKNLGSFINPTTDQWNGAYAPRIVDQLSVVIEALRKDPDTRQAILSIYKADDTIRSVKPSPDSLDIPCTISLQFLIRDGKLNMITTMRSNDVLWGLTYDVNQFIMIAKAISCILGIPTGFYQHQAGSMHSYDEREDQLQAVLTAQLDIHFTENFSEFKHPEWPSYISIEKLRYDISMIMHGLRTREEDGSRNPFIVMPNNMLEYYYSILLGETKV